MNKKVKMKGEKLFVKKYNIVYIKYATFYSKKAIKSLLMHLKQWAFFISKRKLEK